MTNKFFNWYKTSGKLRRYIFFTALVGKITFLAIDPPSGLSDKLLMVDAPYLIGLKLLSAFFSGVIIVECIRFLFDRLTTSWSIRKHFWILLATGLIFIVIQAIFAMPVSSKKYYAHGWSLDQKGDFEGAVKSLDIAIGLNPKDTTSYLERGWAYRKLSNYTMAVADYSKAIQMNPQNAKSYVGRGYAYYYMGNFEKALLDWKHAITVDPSVEKDLVQWIKVASKKQTAMRTLGEP